jgi:hypothetical protein
MPSLRVMERQRIRRTHHPVKDNAHSGTRGTKRNKKKCIHCEKHVFHKSVDCYKLKANANKRWTGWKSVKDNSGASA